MPKNNNSYKVSKDSGPRIRNKELFREGLHNKTMQGDLCTTLSGDNILFDVNYVSYSR